MPDFALEAWEWPRGGERRYLIAPFLSTCLAKHGFPQVTLCTVPYHSPQNPKGALVFFRPEPSASSANPAFNYLVAKAWFPLVSFAVLPNNRERNKLERVLAYHFQRDFVSSRVFQLPHTEATLLVSDEMGVWHDGFDSLKNAHFALPKRGAMLYSQKPSPALYRWFQQQFLDSHSELHSAYDWHLKSQPQRFELWLNTNPNARECLRLMHTIVRMEAVLLPDTRWYLGCDREPSYLQTPESSFIEINPKLEMRVKKWGRILQKQFPLRRNLPKKAPLCWQDAHRLYRSHLHVNGETPSLHEQLEARLYLRAWAQDKATPAEIAILFPDDLTSTP